jgi:catechol 2,3-dioxygenase-like lactoylglutathione lyase family enzyme
MQQIAPIEVGLPVIDLDRMHDFYCTVLGCTEVRRADIPATLSNPLTAGMDGYVNVWLRTPGGEVIKLMRPPAAPRRTASRAALSERTGFAYLTFYCQAIDTVLAAAERHGAVLRSARSLLDGTIGVKLAFFEDPEGNVIELVEPVANR